MLLRQHTKRAEYENVEIQVPTASAKPRLVFLMRDTQILLLTTVNYESKARIRPIVGLF